MFALLRGNRTRSTSSPGPHTLIPRVLACPTVRSVDGHGVPHPLQLSSIDQFDRLLFVTVAPLIALVVLWLAHVFMPRIVSILSPATADPATQATHCATYRLFIYRASLVMLFTIYPGLSTEIVKSFRCMGAPTVTARPPPVRLKPQKPRIVGVA